MKTTFRYGLAIVSVAIALVLTQALASFVAPMRLIFFWCAVLLTAILGGSGPAAVAVVLATIGATITLFAPFGSLTIANPTDVARLALFVVFASSLSALASLRRRAEQRAASSSRWLATTLGSIGDAVIATDAHGRIAFMNAVAETLTGWRAGDAAQRPIGDVFVLRDELSGEPVTSPVEKVLRDGVIVELANHTVLVRPDGSELPIEDTAAPIRDASGAMTGVVLVFHDVTHQRRLQNELRASEARYRTLVEATPLPQAIWSATPEGAIRWSDRWARITGQSDEELLAGHGMDVVHPDDVQRTSDRWARALKEQLFYEDEIRVRVAGGRYRWFTIRAVPVRDDQGNIREWVGIIADIHDRKRHEEEAAFMNRATELLGSSLDYEVTLRNFARLCVPELCDWCAIDIARDHTYERLVVEHTDPAKVKLAFESDRRFRPSPQLDPIAQVMRTRKTQLVEHVTDELLTSIITDPEHLEIARGVGLRSWIIAPMIARGRTLGVISVVQGESGRGFNAEDVALIEELARRAAMAVDNARLFEEAEAASRAKDEFLATLSHELRTPLTAIAGWASMLRMGGLDQATTKTAVDTIARSAKAQGELIDELLDLSRVIAGKLHLDITAVNFATVVDEVVIAARPAAEARRVDLRFDEAAPVILVKGDERRLRQIAWNLVTNAVKFTGADGRVDVRLTVQGAVARLEVRDTGRGIAPEFLPHVWERFRQADSSTSRAHGGLGLGLAVVRHLVDLHGGAVSAESEGLGRGSLFTVELPLAALAPFGVESGKSDSALPVALPGWRVLIVEDDAPTRTMLGTVLGQHGARVTTVEGTEEALAALRNAPFDIVLSDIAMPGADGYELLRRIRAEWPVPVIAISAMGASEERERALNAGFAEFLRKPIDPAQLTAQVARHAAA